MVWVVVLGKSGIDGAWIRVFTSARTDTASASEHETVIRELSTSKYTRLCEHAPNAI
jgi:hypothetical protein